MGEAQQEREQTLDWSTVYEDLRALIRATRPEDWMDYGGGLPYLVMSGCGKAEVMFHISYSDLRWEPPEILGDTDENSDRIVNYTVAAKFHRADGGSVRDVAAVGTSSTDEKQIVAARRPWTMRNGQRVERTPPLNVGEARTRAKDLALASCRHRGICAILGIGTITWEDLEAHGITRDQVRQRDGGARDVSRGGSSGDSSHNNGLGTVPPINQSGARDAKDYVWKTYNKEFAGQGDNGWKMVGDAGQAVYGREWRKKPKDMAPEEFEPVALKIEELFGKRPANGTSNGTGSGGSATSKQIADLGAYAQALHLDQAAKGRLLRECGQTDKTLTIEVASRAQEKLAAECRTRKMVDPVTGEDHSANGGAALQQSGGAPNFNDSDIPF